MKKFKVIQLFVIEERKNDRVVWSLIQTKSLISKLTYQTNKLILKPK